MHFRNSGFTVSKPTLRRATLRRVSSRLDVGFD
jgi:hypothetical protein